MLHAAQRLTSGAGQTRRYGFASTVLQAQDVFFFLDRAGASAATGNGASLRPSFTDPQVAQAIRTYLDLLRASSPHQRLSGYMRGEFQTDAVELVSAGRVGMWFDFGAGFFGLGRLRTPDFVHAIAPPPLDGAATSNDFRVSGLYIAAQTPHPEACWAWLKHLSEQSIGLGGAFPARRSVAESPSVRRPGATRRRRGLQGVSNGDGAHTRRCGAGKPGRRSTTTGSYGRSIAGCKGPTWSASWMTRNASPRSISPASRAARPGACVRNRWMRATGGGKMLSFKYHCSDRAVRHVQPQYVRSL